MSGSGGPNNETYFIESKQSGVLSGSVFTNFLDSWVNLFVINYCMIKVGNTKAYTVNVMGDDSVIGTDEDGHKLLALLKACCKYTFGMSVGIKSNVRQKGEPI